MRTLTGLDVRDQPSALAGARQLQARGAGHVIVSTGNGTLPVMGDAERWYPNLPVDRVDTTGAGDAFAGALAVGLVEGQSLPAAVAFAHAAAAVATTRVGAMPSLPRRDAVQRLIDQQPDFAVRV
jgi:ribokinase